MRMNIKDIIKAGGGVASLGRAIGRDHSTLLGWKQVPAKHVLAVSRATGIPPHELRPDLAKLFVPTPEAA